MTRQSRPFIVVALILVALIGILNIFSQTIVGGSYAALEEQSVRRNLNRALNIVAHDLEELNSKASDWATWDAAYEFVQGENPEFAETEVTALALQHLDIDLMLFLQPDGRLVLGRAVDLAQGVEVPLPKSVEDLLADRKTLNAILQSTDLNSRLTGILLIRENPLMIAARPIVTSAGNGPTRGTLIFGHYLDRHEAREMSATIQLSLTFQRNDQPPLPDDFQIAADNLSDANPLFVTSVNEQVVNGYASIHDIFGKPAIILRVDETRDVYQQGQAAIRYFMLASIGIGIIATGITHLFLSRLVRSRRELSESEERYHAVIEQASEGIFLYDAATLRVVEANAALRRLLGLASPEILALTLHDIFALEPAALDEMHRRVLREKIAALGEQRVRRRDGATFDAEASASVITFSGRPVIATVVHDITERKRAQDALERLYEQEQSRRQELDSLYALSRGLADTVDFHAMLDLVTLQSVNQIHTTFARILLIEGDELAVVSAFPVRALGRDLDGSQRARLAEAPICARLLRANAPAILHHMDATLSARERELLALDLAQSLCAVPLRVEDRAIGLLTLGESRTPAREQFTPEKISLAKSIADQTASALRRAELFAELEQTYLQTVLALASAVDAKDTYTHDHAKRLSEMASTIGVELEMSKRDREDLHYGAILHDIGKIGVADAILQKPARLNADEWVKMREHPEIGAQILAPVPRLAGAARIVRHHHERWDGQGYPDQLAGEKIPLGARILTVVDSFSAIMDARVYKPGGAEEQAIAELKKHAGAQFDPRVVEIFLQLLVRGEIGKEERSERVSVGTN